MGLRVLLDNKVSMTQQRALVSKKASCVLGALGRALPASRLREVILSLWSTLVKAHLGYCAVLWDPQHKRDMELLEWVQWGPMKIVKGLEHLSYEEWVRELGQISLEKR
ncbi:hypothetical protein DUI87_22802 [Hirundo rustica rustica]|uniref:Uncharacterized protein n=1 Tax=Hirundo rustica rustica TaxID=333673 RepID=A0A3M0JNA8_HIRRU|nr:hypothetical protein DUI87_22802 [Hirundo rustica rustica]